MLGLNRHFIQSCDACRLCDLAAGTPHTKRGGWDGGGAVSQYILMVGMQTNGDYMVRGGQIMLGEIMYPE